MPTLCEWHAAALERYMSVIVGDVEKARIDVAATLARSCDDCEV